MSMTVEEFGKYTIDYLTRGNDIILSPDDIAEIEAIERTYYSPTFLYGRHKSRKSQTSISDIHRHKRLDGIGEFDIFISLNKRNEICNLSISGDFFMLDDIDSKLIKPLKGVEYTILNLTAAIDTLDPSIVHGLNRKDLLSLLI